MIIVSVTVMILLTDLVGVIHFLKCFKDHSSGLPSELYFAGLSTSAWWLVNIFGSFWVMLHQETKSVICLLAYPPFACSLSLLFLLWSRKFFKALYSEASHIHRFTTCFSIRNVSLGTNLYEKKTAVARLIPTVKAFFSPPKSPTLSPPWTIINFLPQFSLSS